MKANKKIVVTMTDRTNWLKGWLILRQYDIGDKRKTFIHIYYCTLLSYKDAKWAMVQCQNINHSMAKPLEEDEVNLILQKVNTHVAIHKANYQFTNETIIRLLDITQEEVDKLRIGHHKKEAEARKLRVAEQKKLTAKRNEEIVKLYLAGHTMKEITAARSDASLSTVKRILKPYSEQTKRERDEKIIKLDQEGKTIAEIAKWVGCSRNTVYQVLNEPKEAETFTIEIKETKCVLPPFVDAECSSVYSMYMTECKHSRLDEQARALAILQVSQKNIALLGTAGTGKSYLMKQFLDSLSDDERKATLVVAPTGMAASHLNAVTIHKAFQLSNDVQSKDEITDVPEILLQVKRIIVDEVNMTRIDVFSRMMKMIQFAEKKTGKRIQVIVIGDFGQIAPVATDTDKELLNQYYPEAKGSVYAFQSEEWERMKFKRIVLKRIHRQKEPEFIDRLRDIKYGKTDAIKWFNEHTDRTENTDAIYICATNDRVDYYNQKAMNQFGWWEKEIFEATIKGEIPEDELPCPEVLTLAEGMKVMTICNTKTYKNGSRGTITKINEKSIQIKLDGGGCVTVGKKKFRFPNGATFEQLPIVLAYAITANKAEGLTFDQINIVSGFFASGQLYTALSRCTSLRGIHLLKDLEMSDLKVDKDALLMTVNRRGLAK